MKSITSNKQKTISLLQVRKMLQKEAAALGLEWADEFTSDFSTEVEFLLGLRGWWLLCRMSKSYPYAIRFRLIGEKTYEKTSPKKFVGLAKEKLLH